MFHVATRHERYNSRWWDSQWLVYFWSNQIDVCFYVYCNANVFAELRESTYQRRFPVNLCDSILCDGWEWLLISVIWWLLVDYLPQWWEPKRFVFFFANKNGVKRNLLHHFASESGHRFIQEQERHNIKWDEYSEVQRNHLPRLFLWLLLGFSVIPMKPHCNHICFYLKQWLLFVINKCILPKFTQM